MTHTGLRPGKEKALARRLQELGLFEKDFDEKFIRARGKGGQKVNKTSSCVYLCHRPSGIEVKVDRERSQNLNRFLARRLLADRYEKEVLGRKTESDRLVEKKKKQKKRRWRRTRQPKTTD